MGDHSQRWDETDWKSLPTASRHHIRSIATVLASMAQLLPQGLWHLKGSTALLGWTGPSARLPNDVDLAMPVDSRHLLSPSTLPPGLSGDRVRVMRSEPVVFSSPDRATAHRVLVEVRGTEGLAHVLLNVLLLPDTEATNDVRTQLMDFPDPHSPVTVPAATFSRCLAQKLLRYTRRRGDGKINTRWTDLTDFLLSADCPRSPRLFLDELRRDVAIEFAAMGRRWPTDLPPPPLEWLDFWDTAVFRDGLRFGRLPEAVEWLAGFWNPVLAHPSCGGDPLTLPAAAGGQRMWSPNAWRWSVYE